MFKFIFFIFLIICTATPSFKITVANIQDWESPVYLLVFDSPGGFPSQVESSVFSWTGSPIEAETGIFPDLPGGAYAVSVFQDSDQNGRLSKKFYGAPREPFGVSGTLSKPRRPPGFSRSSLRIEPDDHLIIYLWNP